MRILHVITSLYTGGAEKLMVDLIPELKKEGHEVDLLLFDGTETPFRKQAEELGITVYDFGKGNSVYNPFNIPKLIPYLRNYDIIHTHNTSPQFFTAIAGLFGKSKLITTEHNTTNRRRKWISFKWIDKWMYSRYEKIICISDKAEQNLREFLNDSSSKIITINNGINLERFHEAVASDTLDKLAPGSKKIIMVAAFREQKDQPTLIRAIKELPEEFHLFLVGDGEKRLYCEKLVSDLGLNERIHFLGIKTDIPSLLKEADYVVMSSHYEGLSLSSIEGMSVGKPFLASDVDGLHDIVKDAGILFPHEDYSQLANEIMKLDKDKKSYESISQNCLSRSSIFEITKMVIEYSEIYTQIFNL